MAETNLQALLSAARTRVSAVRACLARPLECRAEECVTRLREAQGYLEWLRDSLPGEASAGQELRSQMVALAREIQQTDILLEQGVRCGRRWLEHRRSGPPEYTPAGGHVPVQIAGSLSLVG